MAILQINPSQGSGNGSSQIGTAEHTYRDNRSTTVRFRMKADTNIYTDVAVISRGIGRKFDGSANKSEVPASGGVVEISGTSNIPVISFRKVAGNLSVKSLIFQIDEDDVSVIELNNTQTYDFQVPNDPGKDHIYNFTLGLLFAETMSSSSNSGAFSIGDVSGGNLLKSFRIAQAAANYLTVSPTELNFSAEGGTEILTIDTNESWTIE